MKNIEGSEAHTHILLPLPPLTPHATAVQERDGDTEFEMDIYVRFMRCLRRLVRLPRDMAILASVQIVADMVEMSVVEISRVLVNMGLRAPRMAFPESFLAEIDLNLMNEDEEFPYSYPLARDLCHHWQYIREDMYAHCRLSTA